MATSTAMTRVLVVRPSSLGDVVYALAIAADMRRAHPGVQIDWVAEEGFAALPALDADVAQVITVALRRWRGSLWRASTWREFRAFRRAVTATRYDAVIDLQEQLKGAIIARIARGPRHGLAAASIREPLATILHDAHHAVDRDIHFVAKCRAIAASAMGYAVEGPPRWHWRALPATPATPQRPYAIFVTATSRPTKLWPEERWRALATHLGENGLAVLLPWGTHEEEARCRRIADGIADASVPSRLALHDAAALIAHADLVVGVDTGLTHLAAALGVATIALFTETDAALAGVAICGGAARDLGGNGIVPGKDDVIDALGDLYRLAPRC
ncbi:MAG TPA: lipopolysaccharide heptosyltransferase I [Casimicrobiaceae bacterium]|jgi:heptosyltransferase-1